MWGNYAGGYLWFVAVSGFILFGLPLCFFPLRWARMLCWRIPDDTSLVIYLGRCLGVIICVVSFFATRVTHDAGVLPFFFDFMLVNFAAMIVVHLYGALRRIQPWTETAEILFWFVQLLATLCFHPGSGVLGL